VCQEEPYRQSGLSPFFQYRRFSLSVCGPKLVSAIPMEQLPQQQDDYAMDGENSHEEDLIFLLILIGF
jgi:hypothetical protein